MSHETCVMKKPSGGGTGSLITFIMNSLVMMALVFISSINAFAENGSTPDGAEALKMVVLGDSLVAGYGLAPGEDFPAQLHERLKEMGLAVSVENAGVSGDTSSGGLARLDWSIGEGADLVLIELGANDALRGIEPQVTRTNLEEMITRLKNRGISVLLAGMQAPPNMGEDYAASFNPIYADLAKKHDVPLYPFFLDGVAAEASLNQADGIHPTAEGVSVIVDRFLPFLQANLPES